MVKFQEGVFGVVDGPYITWGMAAQTRMKMALSHAIAMKMAAMIPSSTVKMLELSAQSQPIPLATCAKGWRIVKPMSQLSNAQQDHIGVT